MSISIFHFFFVFVRVGNLGWGFITLETKGTNFGERIKAFFKQKKNLILPFIFSLSFNFTFSVPLNSHTALVSFSLSHFFLVLRFLRCVVVNENLKKKKKSVMSFKVPKLNDSELGCIKS